MFSGGMAFKLLKVSFYLYQTIVNFASKILMEAVNERIQTLINTLGESNNRFAQRIDTSSAVISHILTGRNRPNLELIQKILKAFPNLRANWLVLGEGSLYENDNKNLTATPAEAKSNYQESESSSTGSLSFEAPNNDEPETHHNEVPENAVTEPYPIQPLLSNIIQSQRMMLKSVEQQMQMQEQLIEWMNKKSG